MKNNAKKIIFPAAILLIVLFFALSNFSSAKNFKIYFMNLADNFGDFFSSVLNSAELKKENERLVFQNQNLKSLLEKKIDLEKENEFLRKALGLKKERELNLILSDIISKPSLNLSQDFEINKGSKDGVEAGQAIAWPENYLVGLVKEVGEKTSLIQPISDENFRAAVFIGAARIEGLLRGKGLSQPEVGLVSAIEDVKAGDAITTSGLDGKFPRGLYIGEVKKAEKEENSSFYKIEASLGFQRKDLKSVFIVY